MTAKRDGGRSNFSAMIVEDDPDDAHLLERALHKAAAMVGATVEISRHPDGWAALRAVARRDVFGELPDFLVVDLNMPVMDGMRFLRLMRDELLLPDLRAFVLTTSDRPEIHQAARDMGADRVFEKPETQNDLVAIASAMLAACRNGDQESADEAPTRRAVGA